MSDETASTSLPDFGPEAAAALAREHWGVSGSISALPGDRDRNFLIRGEVGQSWVLKVAMDRGTDSAHLGLQASALRALQESWPRDPIPFPEIVPPNAPADSPHPGGDTTVRVVDASGSACLLRLVTYLPGTPLANTEYRPLSLIRELGGVLAQLDLKLADLPPDPGERVFPWDLRQGLSTVDRYISLIQNSDRAALVERSVAGARASMAAWERDLPRALIHNDANDHNILIAWGDNPDPTHRPPRISGLIDFGDMIRTWRVAEVAIAGAYLILSRPAPLPILEALVAGYHAGTPLTEVELAAVLPLIRLRLAISVCMSAHQSRERPDDPYLRVSEAPAWEALELLSRLSDGLAEAHLRGAAGMEPSRAGGALRAWLDTAGLHPAPVLPGLGEVSAATLDLTPGSLDLADLPEGASPRAWTRVLFARMEELGVTIGIGRYGEPRRWYTSPLFKTAGPDGQAWRSVHIGIDLFAPAGTAVHAPLEGVVHSVALNAGELDYGPTVLLRHAPRGAPEFFTLYGHLAWDSVKGLAPGTAVRRGEAFAALGAEEENGGWAPHLHFQAVSDLLNYEGEFPGVALPRDREVWCSLSPNPAPLLGITVSPPPGAREMPPAEVLMHRDRHLGPGLSLSYRRPLKIVRGWMQYLYDHEGQTLLDGVNNVPHVGHCHPRVVEAARRQMAVLNTNTRYLHDELAHYCHELQATLPDPLSVVYLVCSGSEANELALRLARTHTGRRDIIALEAAYHGNTTLLVEASDYKSGGPGGAGPGDWVHTAPLPDVYRGKYRASASPHPASSPASSRTASPASDPMLDPATGTDPGAAYALEVAALVAAAQAAGRPIGAYLAESLPGCGGQVVLPAGYLRASYQAVRAGGGVCIADEVQVGFGRVGTHFWGFETQGVVPDIVTLGKPIGNGHPLGAVVTTPEIAASFDNGMEYFNTFGGNPVSCAVGREVLAVIRDEDLQARARSVGGALRTGLQDLATRHPLIGDVRGLGLYLGVELVTAGEARTPAAHHASWVVNRLRDRGFLLSTDGPDHNVIKIKPPLQFSAEDAAALVQALDDVLREEPARVG